MTEQGVRYLCVDDGTHGKCTLLRVLKLSEFEDNLTAEGLVVALENLPQLRILHHKNLIHAVVLYAKTHPGAPPLSLAGEIILNYRVSASDWTLLCAMMPNVDDLKLSSDMRLKISEINKLSHIKCLEMKRNFTKAFNFPTDFSFHSSITELRLILEYSSFDISLITKFCRNLIVLVLKAEPSETNAYSLHGKFEVLELLTIEGDFPFIPVQNMLSSTRLMKATVAKVSGLTDAVLTTICTKAEEDGETLSRLAELHLCKVNALTVESIKHLVCMCPRLTKLKIDNSAHVKSQAAELKEFLYTHKLHDNLFVKIT